MLKLLLFILFAYLIGSLSAAIIISKLFGLPDPRSEGSKNPGATNVLRLGGKKVAIIVLFGDFLKGLIPVLLATAFGLPPMSLAWVGLAAVLGHIFPLYFGFKGGKGVATGAGVFFALSWKLGTLALFTWIVIAALFQYSSLAAIIGSIAAPFYTFWLIPECIIPVALLCLLLLWRHVDNFKRLLAGQEDKIGKSKRVNDKEIKQKPHKHFKQKQHRHFKQQHYKKSSQQSAEAKNFHQRNSSQRRHKNHTPHNKEDASHNHLSNTTQQQENISSTHHKNSTQHSSAAKAKQ